MTGPLFSTPDLARQNPPQVFEAEGPEDAPTRLCGHGEPEGACWDCWEEERDIQRGERMADR